MKTLFLLLPMVWVCSCAMQSGREVSDKGIVADIKAPPTLQLAGESYAAGYSVAEDGKCEVAYYRAGESRKSWKKVLTLRLNEGGPSSLQSVQSTEASVKAGGASAVRSFRGANSDSYGIEFTIMGKDLDFVELDVFLYVNRPYGPGTVSLQYAERIPSGQLRAIGEAKLPEYYTGIRSKALKAMEAIPIPMITKSP